MPSGAKKRKAAKKKKEAHNNKNSSNNGNSNIPQGNDDARSQDERDSDGGEVSSPVSQDRQPPSSEENDESEKRSTQSFVSKNKPQETGNEEASKEAASEDNAAIKIESEFAKEDSESQVVHMEYVESAKEVHDRDHRSSSSSSSSDDESQSYQKKWDDETNDIKLKTSLSSSEEKAVGTYSEDAPQSFDKEKPLVEHNGNTVVEGTPVDTSTPVVPASEVAERVVESSEVQSTEVLEVIESGLPQNEDKSFPNSSEAAAVSFDAVASANDDKVSPTLEENDGTSLQATGPVINGSESKTLTSSDHTAETSINADTVNDSSTSKDLPGGSKDEELPMSNVQTARSSDVAPKAKDAETHESTEGQPLIAPAPRVAQRTSWMSCCGLLDVFTGSGR